MTTPNESENTNASPVPSSSVPAPSLLSQKLNASLFGYSADLPRVVELEVNSLIPNPDQPRQYFDPESLAELAASIEAQGLLQPILVQRLDDGFYGIVAGERRYRAHGLLKRSTIPAIVVSNNTDEITSVRLN
jgi:ParB family transcriptional regulator, chromosome partitioning protein